MTKIRNVFLLIGLLLIHVGNQACAQVGIGTTTPTNSSILDLVSSSKGLLVPRMTLTEKNEIQSPANGLLIYQTDGLAGFWYYTGAVWVPFIYGDDAWRITGNSGTIAGTNYIGTNDAVDFVTKTNNSERMRVTSGGNVGIGTSTPGQKMETMNGNILLNNNNDTAGELRFAEPSASGNHYTSIKARAQGADITYNLPLVQGGVNTALINDGSGNLSWGTGAADFKQKSVNESVVSSTTLQDDDDFTFNLTPNRTYLITALISASCQGNSGIDVKFTAPSGATEFMYVFLNKSGADQITYITSPTTEYQIASVTVTAGQEVIVINGTVSTAGTGGAFTMQWAQHNSDVTPAVLYAGSYMTIQVVK